MRLPWRGFTLIELIVVVLILGILAAVVTVGYAAMTERAQVTAARAQLAQVAKAVLAKATVEGSQHLDRQLVLDAMEESLGAEVVDGETAAAWRLLDADTTPETVNDIAVAFLTATGDAHPTAGHTAVLITAAGKGLAGHKVAAAGLSCALDTLGEANTAAAVAAAAVGCSASGGTAAPEDPEGPGDPDLPALPAPTGVVANWVVHPFQYFNWDDVENATSYHVVITDSADNVVFETEVTTANAHTEVLVRGQEYVLAVTPVAEGYTGTPATLPFTAFDGLELPAAPTGLTAVARHGAADISWVHGGNNVSNFEVTVLDGETAVWSQTTSSHARTVTATGLTNGVTYTVRVTPVFQNLEGQSATTTVTPQLPPAPTSVSVQAKSGAAMMGLYTSPSLLVTWSQSVPEGSAAPTFRITATPVGGGSAFTVNAAQGASSASVPVEGDGKQFDVVVTAVWPDVSVPSAPTRATTLAAPTDFNVEITGRHTFAVTATAPPGATNLYLWWDGLFVDEGYIEPLVSGQRKVIDAEGLVSSTNNAYVYGVIAEYPDGSFVMTGDLIPIDL